MNPLVASSTILIYLTRLIIPGTTNDRRHYVLLRLTGRGKRFLLNVTLNYSYVLESNVFTTKDSSSIDTFVRNHFISLVSRISLIVNTYLGTYYPSLVRLRYFFLFFEVSLTYYVSFKLATIKS